MADSHWPLDADGARFRLAHGSRYGLCHPYRRRRNDAVTDNNAAKMTMRLPIKAIFLTSFNRPQMLAQSLPALQRQAFDCGLDLVIFDDGSTDSATLTMLQKAADSEFVTLSGRTQHDGLHAHLSVGRNFLEGVAWMLDRYGPDAAFIKADDDIVLAPNAIHRLVDAWGRLDGFAPATLSAMVGPHTQVVAMPFPDIAMVDSSCSTLCVHRLDLWRDNIQESGVTEIVKVGWDTHFFWGFLFKLHPDLMRCFATKPSLIYHAGHMGVHLLNTDHNRRPPDPFAFPGNWVGDQPVGVTLATGDLETWKIQYADRTFVPSNG